MSATTPQRVVVIGVTGSGKTTFARGVADSIGAPCVELDALHWEPGWQAAPPETFLARVAAATAGERWVADGNYSRAQGLLWPRAEAIVWLDYPFPRGLSPAAVAAVFPARHGSDGVQWQSRELTDSVVQPGFAAALAVADIPKVPARVSACARCNSCPGRCDAPAHVRRRRRSVAG
jgi:hypothetical protein